MDEIDNCVEAYDPNCPVTYAVGLIGGKWKLVIIYHLRGGILRFNAMRRLIPDVTQQMLTLQLRELERDGIVHRHVYAQVPPKVEYSLTPHGQQLIPLLNMLGVWGKQHQEQLQAEMPEAAETLSS
jgi:DNA-binding HxlR family transcriptional regulator